MAAQRAGGYACFMNISRLRSRALSLAVVVSFLAQTTGAADLAVLAGARTPAAALLPPRALLAPRPAAGVSRVAPAAPSAAAAWAAGLLQDARTVLAWLVAPEQKPESRVEWQQVRAVPATAAISAAPADSGGVITPLPSNDRILIARDPEIVGVSQALGQALSAPDILAMPTRPATLERVEGAWLQGRGFSYRVVYLDALGKTIGKEGGFTVVRPYSAAQWVKARVPAFMRRAAPIYFHGMTVRFQVEVRAKEDLAGLRLSFRQEELDGTPLTRYAALGQLTLKAGARGVVSGETPLLGRQESGPVNFERTHLVASVAGESSARLDAPDAGLVDPPGAQ